MLGDEMAKRFELQHDHCIYAVQINRSNANSIQYTQIRWLQEPYDQGLHGLQ